MIVGPRDWGRRAVAGALALARLIIACHCVACLPRALGGCACGGAPPVVPFRDGEIGFIDAGAPPDLELALYAALPARGPFTGGNVVVLRASGLDATTWAEGCARCEVTFGGAPATGVRFVDEHRLEVIAPPGPPGAVDVRIAADGVEASLASGYVYDALAIAPAAGSDGGGTWVTVRLAAPAFDAGTVVLVGGARCTGVAVASPDLLTCYTPPGELGLADVEARGAATIVAPEAYRYEDPTLDGLLGGGPLAGTIEVAVFGDDGPLAGAVVLAGPTGGPLSRTTTDARGLAAIGGPMLAHGPIDLHVGAPCYSPTSILRFATSRATVHLGRYWVGCTPPDPVGGTSPLAAFVSGRLDVRGWAGVPERPGEVRVVRVLATSRFAGFAGEDARVLGSGGYRIAARAGLVAIVAIAGTEDSAGRLAPTAMGIARGVLLAPGEERTGVDVTIDIPLDRTFHADIEPPGDGLDHLSATLRIDEGYVVRGGSWGRLDEVDGAFGARVLEIPAEPALAGPLADARFEVVAVHTITSGTTSTRRLREVASHDVRMDFLPLPLGLSPIEGAAYGGTLRWTADGAASMTYAYLSDGALTWSIYGPGDLTEAILPDFADVALERPSGTTPVWGVIRYVVPGLELERLGLYDFAYATHEAACTHSARW